MKVLIAGGTGFIGNALRISLEADRHQCLILSRNPGKNTVLWNPQEGSIESEKLVGVDAVVNLAGSNIACRWTNATKDTIRESRIASTALLCRTLATLRPVPRVLINTSAIGYYGITASEPLAEESPVGEGFLADVCKAWEAQTQPATTAGIRTVLLRIGVVLSPQGGALKKMLPAFRLGAGATLGSGRQQMSWIALDDLVGLIRFALQKDSVCGALNAVAPSVVTNAEFSHTLGATLGRPVRLKVSARMLKLIYGQMAEETLLSSVACSSQKAQRAGYRFCFPELNAALEHLLKG